MERLVAKERVGIRSVVKKFEICAAILHFLNERNGADEKFEDTIKRIKVYR